MARSIPRIAGLTLCAAAIGHLTIAFGFAADTETAGAAIAIVDFNYVDTSGEVRDQRAEHEVRLSVFMNTLKDDLAASCQSASDRAPRSASKGDPLVLHFERLAFAPSELVGVAETGRARVDV
jgi:hypothetical protein